MKTYYYIPINNDSNLLCILVKIRHNSSNISNWYKNDILTVWQSYTTMCGDSTLTLYSRPCKTYITRQSIWQYGLLSTQNQKKKWAQKLYKVQIGFESKQYVGCLCEFPHILFYFYFLERKHKPGRGEEGEVKS